MFSSIANRIRWYVTRLKVSLGIPIRLRGYFADREVFEGTILPFFASEARFRSIVFIGCEVYTAHYRFLFRRREYTTLEIDPSKRLFGARRHIVDSVGNLDRHCAADSIDLILMNGVIGWGLNDAAEAERALSACYKCLAPDGVLMIGWDDIPERRPYDPLRLCGLGAFSPYVFPPFGTNNQRVQGIHQHTFSFFMKQNPQGVAGDAAGNTRPSMGDEEPE